ncbi:TPA: phospholipase D family protein [Pseudomonas aeruginosa]|uniref:phospholipase D family protein n=2 Tax=Pseudomonas aeruginosa TaxID=287 RepID=UPI00148C6177|nr:phospholipase D family protein [Pseudomonas aeruginosa]
MSEALLSTYKQIRWVVSIPECRPVKLISTNTALKSNLLRLIRKYDHISFGTAWASAGTDVFTELIKAKAKINLGVIGTHFYQTHPDVLDEFVCSRQVRFTLQPEGVFHPKVFAFWTATSWEVLIGSANLTAGAIKANTELSTLITHEDGTPELLSEVLDIISGYEGRSISQVDADNYRRIWGIKARLREKLEGTYGGTPTSKPEVESPVMTMDWPTFYAEIQKDKTHGFADRLGMLEQIASQFANVKHFNDIPLQERLGIAGLRSKAIKNSEWFGSMTGAGMFYKHMNASTPAFSKALDAIPPKGPVTKDQYDAFIKAFVKGFPNGRHGLGTATRLLSMKRPDVFLCVDGQNKKKLAQDVGMVRADKLDYDRYWTEVVERLQEAPWWKSPRPVVATKPRLGMHEQPCWMPSSTRKRKKGARMLELI